MRVVDWCPATPPPRPTPSRRRHLGPDPAARRRRARGGARPARLARGGGAAQRQAARHPSRDARAHVSRRHRPSTAGPRHTGPTKGRALRPASRPHPAPAACAVPQGRAACRLAARHRGRWPHRLALRHAACHGPPLLLVAALDAAGAMGAAAAICRQSGKHPSLPAGLRARPGRRPSRAERSVWCRLKIHRSRFVGLQIRTFFFLRVVLVGSRAGEYTQE